MSIVKLKSSYKAKIIVLGSANSGKTTFCAKHANYFSKKYKLTVGVDIFIIDTIDPEDNLITLTCWLCAPEERFELYHSRFFRGARGAFIIFDLTDINSFTEVDKWKEAIYEYVGKIPILLIGNKLDLKGERVIDYKTAKEYADKEKFIGFIEISALNDINVFESFELMNKIIYRSRKADKEQLNHEIIDSSIKNKINSLQLNLDE